MTVCVAVKVHDCLVFAADSASSLFIPGTPNILNVFQHGNKVFNLLRGKPVCAMTCGLGNIGESSIATLAKDLRRRMTSKEKGYDIDLDNFTIEEVAVLARKFLYEEKFKAISDETMNQQSLELYVGGYSTNEHASEIWKVAIVNGDSPEPECLKSHADMGINWSGDMEAISRLVLGYGAGLPDALKAGGVTDESLGDVMKHIAANTQTQLAWPSMPVQDAIELAEFLVNTTKQFVRFRPGADTVGGDIDVATVTKYEGFKWIKRKHYYPSCLNLETDHV